MVLGKRGGLMQVMFVAAYALFFVSELIVFRLASFKNRKRALCCYG